MGRRSIRTFPGSPDSCRWLVGWSFWPQACLRSRYFSLLDTKSKSMLPLTHELQYYRPGKLHSGRLASSKISVTWYCRISLALLLMRRNSSAEAKAYLLMFREQVMLSSSLCFFPPLIVSSLILRSSSLHSSVFAARYCLFCLLIYPISCIARRQIPMLPATLATLAALLSQYGRLRWINALYYAKFF